MEHTGTYVLPELDDEPPLARTNEPPSNVDSEADPERRPRILLVDDDIHMLEVQLRSLRSMGYPFNSAATSGMEALLQLEHDPGSADLIVCDLGMPGMDGIEFLQTLNVSSFHGSVILLSGESARVMHSVQRLLGGGQLTILGALTKPARRDALRALLECWRPRVEATAKRVPYAFSAAEIHAATPGHQWELHYQPQVHLRTGAVVGMEALLRWNHPKYGLVYPNHFITLAEDCGGIDEITDWVVRGALQQQARWRADGLKLDISLNISMQSLRVPDFWRRIRALVREAGTAPEQVTLEVTETQIGASSGIPLENLIRLSLERFTLSIDDFGTGHSSLAQLCDVPFTELKIDQGFVHGARNNQIIRPMLEGSLGIAKRMRMQAVAEGVETQADWELVRELDCDLAQGYFIARPMRVARVWEWLYEWQPRISALTPV